MPFRVKVNLSEYFSDYRKDAYVYVEDESWSTVKDLQDHISRSFKINKNIYLSSDNIFIPDFISIKAIRPEDVLVVQNQLSSSKPGIITSSPHDEASNEFESQDQEQEKESKKKRKRKRLKKKSSLSFEELEHEMEVIFKHPTASISAGGKLGKHTRYNDDGEEDMDKIDEEMKPPYPKYRLTDPVLQEARKNSSEPGPAKIVEAIEISSSCNSEISNNHNLSASITNGTISDETTTEIGQNDSQPILETNSHPNETAMEEIRQNVDGLNLPVATELPQENDVIAFKYLRVGENYTPQVSEYIVGMIESVDRENENLKIYILAGNDQVVKPNGKFAVMVMEVDEMDNDAGTLVISWSDLLEPRVIRV